MGGGGASFRILGGPRFRILGGGQGLEYWGGGARFRIFFFFGGGGGQGGPNFQQAHDVVMTSMRRNDVASTSCRRRVPTRFLINQCQIIIFLILKYDFIENSRIELRGIILPVQVGGLLGGGGGGGNGYVGSPPLKLLGGLAAPAQTSPPPLPTPMTESIELDILLSSKSCNRSLSKHLSWPPRLLEQSSARILILR